MNRLFSILIYICPIMVFGQYHLDDTIQNNSFLALACTHDNDCSLINKYYSETGAYGINGYTKDCYFYQMQFFDSLKVKFTSNELFGIAKFSKFPFYRLAAFEAYAQTNYNKDSLVDFFERNFIHNHVDSIPSWFYPAPNSLLPQPYSIVNAMIGMLDPSSVVYRKCNKLDLETFIYLNSLIHSCENVFCWYGEHVSGLSAVKNGKSYPSFHFDEMVDFGEINLAHADSLSSEFTLKGKFRVYNPSNKKITLITKTGSNTDCYRDYHEIPSQEVIIFEFKSIVNTDEIKGVINREISLENNETGETRVFKFNATFIDWIR